MEDQEPAADRDRELVRLRAAVDMAHLQLVEEHKMAAVGRLTAGIVHEINTPIGSILSNNEVILRSLEKLRELVRAAAESSSPPPGKVAEILETVHSLASVDKIACERISAVIRGLKTFARGEEAELRKVDLHECLQDTLKLTQSQFRRRITVETDFGDLPEIECYPQQLNQVFLNILINAGQAVEGEGKITVRTRLEGDCAHLSIADTGGGIKPEDRVKIFSPGFTTKAVGVGCGLGLSISKRIVEEVHSGALDFESELGAGTTFHIRIPVRQREGRCG